MFLQSCRPASVSPDYKVAITERSQEGVTYALQSRLTLSKDLLRKTSWSFKIIARSYAIQHFINDLFFHVKKAKLNAYADDHQVYYTHIDAAALEACVSHDVGVAKQWYLENGMLVNESKHQGLVLGNTKYGFSSQ